MKGKWPLGRPSAVAPAGGLVPWLMISTLHVIPAQGALDPDGSKSLNTSGLCLSFKSVALIAALG